MRRSGSPKQARIFAAGRLNSPASRKLHAVRLAGRERRAPVTANPIRIVGHDHPVMRAASRRPLDGGATGSGREGACPTRRRAARAAAGRRSRAVVVIALLLLGGWWLMSELQRHRDVRELHRLRPPRLRSDRDPASERSARQRLLGARGGALACRRVAGIARPPRASSIATLNRASRDAGLRHRGVVGVGGGGWRGLVVQLCAGGLARRRHARGRGGDRGLAPARSAQNCNAIAACEIFSPHGLATAPGRQRQRGARERRVFMGRLVRSRRSPGTAQPRTFANNARIARSGRRRM